MDEDLQTWDAWREIHQPFEIDWWKQRLPGHCADPGFSMQWQKVRDWIEPHGDILDIGCGPRPPFPPCTVIEPLAEEYRKITPNEWWESVSIYSQPAEHLVFGLKADTIICWNCIDHTIGWRRILDNMLIYGRPNARFAIATDFQKPFIGHPGFQYRDFMNQINERFIVCKQREPFGREIALLMIAK